MVELKLYERCLGISDPNHGTFRHFCIIHLGIKNIIGDMTCLVTKKFSFIFRYATFE